jgi:hypothetical protein
LIERARRLDSRPIIVTDLLGLLLHARLDGSSFQLASLLHSLLVLTA